ncbi:MAG: shikimate dehydrogenase [Pirellulales bacterium]|nr:shikimate dehydrogenase [Pirellulales bacterium]
MSSSSLQPILALLGHPVGGNPTQYMTEKAFAHHGLDWRYLSLEVAPDDLADAVRGMRAMGFAGGNIGPPHKQTIVPLLERTSQAAGLIRVVNLLLRDEEGLLGENTEGKAAVGAIGQRIKPSGRRAVVLGAGRMARAIAVELALAGLAHLTIVNRTFPQAVDLGELLDEELEIEVDCAEWDEPFIVPTGTDLLVHATSALENDPAARLPLDLTHLTKDTLVIDTTIDPPGTWLLGQAKEHGCPTIDGVEILSRQTALNIRFWTGVEADLAVMREAVEEFLEL